MLWENIEDVTKPTKFNSKRVKCKHYAKSVSVTTANMTTPYSNCVHVPCTLGKLGGAVGKISRDGRVARKANSSHLISDKETLETRKPLDVSFPRAIYTNCLPFSVFEDSSFDEFFSLLRQSWKPPSPVVIGGQPLDDT